MKASKLAGEERENEIPGYACNRGGFDSFLINSGSLPQRCRSLVTPQARGSIPRPKIRVPRNGISHHAKSGGGIIAAELLMIFDRSCGRPGFHSWGK
ncbi:hypothetical protein S83_042508 [Arachis hypogaea]